MTNCEKILSLESMGDPLRIKWCSTFSSNVVLVRWTCAGVSHLRWELHSLAVVQATLWTFILSFIYVPRCHQVLWYWKKFLEGWDQGRKDKTSHKLICSLFYSWVLPLKQSLPVISHILSSGKRRFRNQGTQLHSILALFHAHSKAQFASEYSGKKSSSFSSGNKQFRLSIPMLLKSFVVFTVQQVRPD